MSFAGYILRQFAKAAVPVLLITVLLTTSLVCICTRKQINEKYSTAWKLGWGRLFPCRLWKQWAVMLKTHSSPSCPPVWVHVISSESYPWDHTAFSNVPLVGKAHCWLLVSLKPTAPIWSLFLQLQFSSGLWAAAEILRGQKILFFFCQQPLGSCCQCSITCGGSSLTGGFL